MTVVELAKASRELLPTMPTLFATGYAERPDGAQLDLPRRAIPYHLDRLRDGLKRLPGA